MATYYVDPGSATLPGDGSEGDPFGTLALWEAGVGDTDLTGDGVHNVICKATGGTADTSACTINGWTTTASDYIHIYTDTNHRHAGTYSTSKYRMEKSNANVLVVNEEHVRITGLQIKLTSDNSTAYAAYVANTIASGGSDLRVDKCIVVGDVGSNTASTSCMGIWFNDADIQTSQVTNCIVYGFSNNSNTVGRGVLFNVTAGVAYNCTISGSPTAGIARAAGTVTVTNCAVFNNGSGNDFNGTVTADYCATDDDADRGTNGVDLNENASSEWTNAFTSYSTYDFHVKDTSSLLYQAGNGSGMPTECDTDIAGNSRPVTDADWSIGAFEYVAAASGSIVPRLMADWRKRRN